MKKTKNHNIRNIFLALLSVSLLLILIFFGSQNFRQKVLNATNHAQTLNMAVVNEDDGTTYRRQKYNLAKDYLNGLTLPKSVTMDVVPRGVAESGLKKNDYQLVIIIPTDFSKKIVDIDNPNPDKLHIQYKVNAKTQSMKMRCQTEANDIIQGLNKKLVSIYDLGIMSNLFDAQNKVAGIYARQGALASNYSNGLAEPISTLSQGFPDLQESTKSLMNEGQAYQKAQNQVDQVQSLADASDTSSMQNELTKIMQQQSKNNQNAAELAKQTLQTTSTTDDNLSQEMNAVANQNQQLTEAVGDSKDDAADQLQKEFEDYSKAYEEQIASLKKVLQNTNGQLDSDDVKDAINNNNNTNQSHSVSSSMVASSSSEKQTPKTFGEYLKQNDPELYQELMDLDNIDDLNALYAQLPFNGEIPANAKDALTNSEYKKIENDINQINESNLQLKKLGVSPEFNGNSQVVAEFDKDYENKKNQNSQDQSNKEQTQTITLDGFKNVESDTFKITVPDKVKVENAQQVGTNTYQVSAGKASTLTLNLTFKPADLKGQDQTIKVTYNHKEDAPKDIVVTNQTTQQKTQQVTPKGESQTVSESETTSTESQGATVPVTSSSIEDSASVSSETQKVSNDKDRSFTISFNLAGVSTSNGTTDVDVAKDTSKWVAQYDDAAQMAAARVKLLKNRPIQKLMDKNADEVLSALVDKANNQNKQDNSNALATLETSSNQLAQQKSDFEKKLASIGSNSKQELSAAQKQIQQLQQAQDQLNKNAANVNTSDSTPDNTGLSDADLSNLSNQANETNADATQNSRVFDGIYDELTSLNNSLGSIQNSGKSLNGKSMNLQKAFQNELAKSGDFAQSFINVLNAAYKNGVPNQKLLNFITNPVGGNGNEVVTGRTQSYNMGLWTIVLAIMALFIAYAVETMKYFQSGKYFSKKLTKINIHVQKLIFLGIGSLGSGLALAPIAARQFPIIAANRLLWYLSFIFISMAMTLIFYLLIHYLKVLGTGLIIAALLNFIFNQSQFVKNVILEHLNGLSLVGNQLLWVAMFNTTNAVLGLVVMGVVIVACGLMILFIPERQQEVFNEQTMV